jgi:hypothetical protein
MIRYAGQVQYRKQRALVKEEILLKHPSSTIVSNEVQKRLLQYYSGFKEDHMHRFISYEEFEADPEREGDLLLLQNGHTRYLSGMDPNDLPLWARDISLDTKALFRSDLPEMALYEMQDLNLLHREAARSCWSDAISIAWPGIRPMHGSSSPLRTARGPFSGNPVK